MEPVAFVVADPSHVSATRLEAQRLARALEFDETRTGRVSIAVTEAVTNMLRHAGGGTLIAQPVERRGTLGLEVIAMDRGPGMPDFAHSATDGVSTAGTAGTGLGAMRRLSDEFDVYTREREGTILRMAFWNAAQAPPQCAYEVGAVCVRKPGESACGDAWGLVAGPQGATFVVADGLGHGPEAARAAALALDAMRRHPDASAIRVLEAAHARLRASRGAAVAVVRHGAANDELAFAGVGNISSFVWDGAVRHSMVSHNGIVGHNVHKSQEYHYPWPRGALLIAHSDGLESHWSLDGASGLARCHPSVIAARLYREHSRKRDDVVVLVARRTE